MPIYSTHQAKTHLSELIRMVERGEIITITRGTIPVASLVRVGALPQARRPGSLAATMRLDPTLDFREGPPRAHPNRRSPPPDLEARAAEIAAPDSAALDSAALDSAAPDSAEPDSARPDPAPASAPSAFST